MRRGGELYLDWNGSAPLCAAARERLHAALDESLGNPSSLHAPGERARRALEDARAAVASLIDARPEELVFTAGGTEANHLAVASPFASDAGGSHLVLTAIEHSSVLAIAERLAERGIAVSHVAPRADGVVAAEDLLAATRTTTRLVVCMAANNETGALQPIETLASALRARGIPLHVDAVQLLGRRPLRVAELGAATVAFSGHKLGGPAGAGALWVARGTRITPWQGGGRQERGRRGGTPALLPLLGFGAAAEAARRRGTVAIASRSARDTFERELLAAHAETTIVASAAPRLPNTSLLLLPGHDGARLVAMLSAAGVHVATGSACQSGAPEPSHVLRALRYPATLARSALRFSFGPDDDDAIGAEAARRLVALLHGPTNHPSGD